MIRINVTELDLGTGVEHLGTDYQVSTSLLFEPENIVIDIVDDRTSKTGKTIDYNGDPSITYYTRARPLLSTGYAEYEMIQEFKFRDAQQVHEDEDLPGRINSPILSTDSDRNSHSPTNFTITASDFINNGDAEHVLTHWYIENLEGDVIWHKEDSINLTSILVNTIMLEEGNVYRLKAMYRSTSNDVSQVSTYTIKVGEVDNIRVISSFNIVEDSDLEVIIAPILLLEEIDYMIYGMTTTGQELMGSDNETLTPTKITIPKEQMIKGKVHILALRVKVDGVWSERKYLKLM